MARPSPILLGYILLTTTSTALAATAPSPQAWQRTASFESILRAYQNCHFITRGDYFSFSRDPDKPPPGNFPQDGYYGSLLATYALDTNPLSPLPAMIDGMYAGLFEEGGDQYWTKSISHRFVSPEAFDSLMAGELAPDSIYSMTVGESAPPPLDGYATAKTSIPLETKTDMIAARLSRLRYYLKPLPAAQVLKKSSGRINSNAYRFTAQAAIDAAIGRWSNASETAEGNHPSRYLRTYEAKENVLYANSIGRYYANITSYRIQYEVDLSGLNGAAYAFRSVTITPGGSPDPLTEAELEGYADRFGGAPPDGNYHHFATRTAGDIVTFPWIGSGLPFAGSDEPRNIDFRFSTDGEHREDYPDGQNNYGPFVIIDLAADPDQLPEDPDSCEICDTGICTAASAEFANNSVDAKFSLGTAAHGLTSGQLCLVLPKPLPDAYDPSMLEIRGGGEFGSVTNSETGELAQFFAPGTIVQITDQSELGYTLGFYQRDGSWHIDGSTGLYEHPGTSPLIATIRIENPDASGGSYNQLKITETGASETTETLYHYDPITAAWTLNTDNGDRTDSLTTSEESGLRTDSRKILDQKQAVISESAVTTNLFDWGTEIVESTSGSGGSAATTRYSYYADRTGDGTSFGKLCQVTRQDGSWTRYHYEPTLGRLSYEIRGFGDLPPPASGPNDPVDPDDLIDESRCHVTHHTHPWEPTAAAPDTVTTVETINATEVSRRYTTRTWGRLVQQRCLTAGAGFGTDINPTTTTTYYLDSEYAGMPKSISQPDGTRSLFSYSQDTAGNRLRAIKSGAPNLQGTDIIAGTTTVTTTNQQGQVIRTRITDAASSLVVQDDIALADSIDPFGRPTLTTHLGGLVSSVEYDCCGVASRTDRFGVTTSYAEDVPVSFIDPLTSEPTLLPAETTTSPAAGGEITTATAYDGLREYSLRIGTAGSVHVKQITEADTAGRIVRRITPVGNSDRFAATTIAESYDPAGHRVLTTTLPDGTTRIETYYLDGRLRSLTGTAAHPHRFEYGATTPGEQFTKQIFLNPDLTDSLEWITTTTGMLGETLRIERSSDFTDGGPGTETYAYDSIGRLIAETDADGVTLLYAYDTLGRRDTVALDRNRNGQIDYDATDRISKTTRSYALEDPDDATSTPVARSTALQWESAGENTPTISAVSERAITGLTTSNSSYGRRTQRSLSYDGSTWIETTVKPDQSYLVRTYIGGTGQTVLESETLFDAAHNAITSMSNSYDSHGRLASTTEARNGGITTTYAYYDSDQLFEKTTPDPGTGDHGPLTTAYTYDNRGRRDRVTLPDSAIVDYGYAPTGELAEVQGARTYHVSYTHDHRGRIRTMKTRPGTALEATTEWTYHPKSGLLARKIAPGGNATTGTNTTSYSYTPAGRLAVRTNGRGTAAAHTYLDSGELAGVAYDDGVTPGVTFTYQRSGGPASRTDASGNHIYAPETAGAYTGSEVEGGVLDQTSVTPTYDQLGRRTGLKLTAGSGSLTFGYSYDAISRMKSVTRAETTATLSFQPDILLPVGVSIDHRGSEILTESRNTDNLGRTTSITSTAQTTTPTPISSTAYTYNQANQKTSAISDGARWAYAYDNNGHLTDATKYRAPDNAEAMDGYSFDYAYDAMGNRTATSTSGSGHAGTGVADTQTTDYNPATTDRNQISTVATPGLVSVAGEAHPDATVTVGLPPAPPLPAARQGPNFHHTGTVDNSAGPLVAEITVSATLEGGTDTVTRTQLVPAATTNLHYDDDGNLVDDGHRTYTWDAENRLTKIESQPPENPPYRVELVYDAAGRRVQKTESRRIGGSWVISSNRRFLYDGWNLVAELEGTLSTPKLARSYTWATDRSGVEQAAGGIGGLRLVTIHHGPAAGSHVPTYDANGNILALVNAETRDVSATYEYDPYGNLLQATGPAATANPFRFSTKYHDDTTGLIYYGLRYYDPNHGRWISRDPIGEDGGTNLYSFVGNDPINATDPLGLVLFAFDGTGNDRAQDSWDAEGDDENTPTNVAVMTDLYRGIAYYIHGVGTRTDKFTGNISGNGTRERMNIQLQRFCLYSKQHPTEPVDIIGFSRGAASARIFSNLIRGRRPNVLIRFLGIFDTVSQMGLPNRSNYQFGYNLDVSEQIGLISHAVAKNEYRSLFPLTSVSKDAYYQTVVLRKILGQPAINAFDPDEFVEIKGSNFIEKPFAGAHSDIGGGYSDGRNIDALRWMINQGQSVGAPFRDFEKYQFVSEIEQIKEPHDSRYIIDAFQGDRVIFPGNR